MRNSEDNLSSGSDAIVRHVEADYCANRHLWHIVFLVSREHTTTSQLISTTSQPITTTSQLFTASVNNFGAVTGCYSNQLDSCHGLLALNDNQGEF
jgi:hypothetical protein